MSLFFVYLLAKKLATNENRISSPSELAECGNEMYCYKLQSLKLFSTLDYEFHSNGNNLQLSCS